METKINTIEECLEDFKNGNFLIVVDDEDRENEGDLIIAGEKITPDKVNFMLKHARGVLCAPITLSRCKELGLPAQVSNNTSMLGTPFTITVDKLEGCTTGVSSHDRAETIKWLANPNAKAQDFGKPGHINPLYAQDLGVLKRAGHTEAAIDLCKLSGLYPVGALMEIMNEDGSMARMSQLLEFAKKYNLKILTIKDLIAYRLNHEILVKKEEEVTLPTHWGVFKIIAYTETNTGVTHLALKKGEWEKDEPILCRVHSCCATGDIFGSMKCDCGDQLHRAMQMVEQEGKGIVLYLNQEGRGIGLVNKLHAYHLQEQGMDTVDANVALGFKPDERNYGIGAQILRDMNATNLRLMTNNPLKRIGLEGFGISIKETVPIVVEPNDYNHNYLLTKKEKMGHNLPIE